MTKFTCSISVLTVCSMRESFLNKTLIHHPVVRKLLVHHQVPHIVSGNSCMRRFLARFSFPANSVLILFVIVKGMWKLLQHLLLKLPHLMQLEVQTKQPHLLLHQLLLHCPLQFQLLLHPRIRMLRALMNLILGLLFQVNDQ